MPQRLLLTIDGSPHAERAVEHVVGRIRETGPGAYEIHLVNVQPQLPGGITSFVSRDQVAGFHPCLFFEATRPLCARDPSRSLGGF